MGVVPTDRSRTVQVPVEKRLSGDDLDSREPVEVPEVVVVRDHGVGTHRQRTLQDGVVVIVVGHVERHRGFDHAGEVRGAFDRNVASLARKRQMVASEDGRKLPEERGRRRRLDGSGLGQRDAGEGLVGEGEFRHEDVGVEDDSPAGHDGE